MGNPRGFITTPREQPQRRPVDVRILDWREVYEPFPVESLQQQAGRCMDCGIPFCHSGCPLGNLIPEWNHLAYTGDWKSAAARLHATNNFPEFTGRLCPAPCETACVVGISADAVSIKQVEVTIVDRAFDAQLVDPLAPDRHTDKTVAVIGSGPAGLACAQQLARAGHTVAVYERADKAGGLLRYGIPEFKLEKRFLDRRLAQLQAEGVRFRTGVNVGTDVTAEALRARYDAVVLAVGATAWRDLDIPGRHLAGVHQAMQYLPGATRALCGIPAPIDVAGAEVVVIGGGDTGADCLGTAIRQGAASVTQLEILPQPPNTRPVSQPWPTYPMLYKVTSAHEEGGQREYAVQTTRFLGDSKLEGLEIVQVEFIDGKITAIPGTQRIIPAQYAFLAMGFTGPERGPLLEQFGVSFDDRGNVSRGEDFQSEVPGVFVTGDAGRGQSLIVWAIAEGRSTAAAVDSYLMGATSLPAPIAPTARPLVLG